MEREEIKAQILATWTRHNELLLYLLEKIPARGMAAVPLESRGRDVARQFAHLDRVRQGWVHYPPRHQLHVLVVDEGVTHADLIAFARELRHGRGRRRAQLRGDP